jgi:hypothetical protein
MGHLDGDLPTDLLNEGEPGHRIRAMARLDGPTHDTYIAIEAPDEDSARTLIDKLIEIGVVVNWQLIACLDQPCLVIIGEERLGGSSLPPLDHILFEVFEAEGIAEALDEAEQALSQDGRSGPHVAASTDGRGQVMVELGSADPELLENVAARLREQAGQSSGGHRVTGDGLLKL